MSALQGLHLPVVVVGAGQAGLAASWHLTRQGLPHVVLERHRLAHEWRSARWDSFRLVTPNWQCQLPGFPYQAGDPDGFMSGDEVVAHLEAYAASFDPPLHERVTVTGVEPVRGGSLQVTTSAGVMTADNVVVAGGSYRVPVVPRLAERLPRGLVQVHSQDYLNAHQLPPGEVLVVGSGQSGTQIAEDLHLAGRRVHLSLGGAARMPRSYRGRDVTVWLAELGHPRATAGAYVTDLRALARDGMRLYGRLVDLVGTELRFRQDLAEVLERADEVSEGLKDAVDKLIADRGLEAPTEPRYVAPWEPETEPGSLDLARARITSVIWAMGSRADHSWVDVPVFTGRGEPGHDRGATSHPGLYFLGLPWQSTYGSGLLSGVGADAEHLVELIRGRTRRHQPRL